MTARIHDFAARRTDAALFVVLTLDKIALALPQHEIAALEPMLDVVPPRDHKSNAAGALVLNERHCPVYALGSELNCLPRIPQQYRICAVLNNEVNGEADSFALACIEVQLAPRAALAPHAMPRMLIKQKTPVKSLLVNQGRLLLATTAADLFAHVARVEADVIPFDELARRAIARHT